MRIVFIGPPGSGKGTQAQLLCQRHHLTHIATGDILREAIRRGTPSGKKAEPFVVGGRLVPDDLVNELIADRFGREDRPDRFIMDGYPRTAAQAAAFDAALRPHSLHLTDVVILQVEDAEIIRRAAGRLVCPTCQTPYHVVEKPPKVFGKCDADGAELVQRADDKEETVRKRLEVYRQSTAELVPFYRQRGLLREVPGQGPIEAISRRIEQALVPEEGRAC